MENIHAVYNSVFSYIDEIKISPLSRAYTFSDSVYEVIPFCNSNLIAFESHICRLKKSCDALNLSLNMNKTSKEITDLISRSNLTNGYVYYQVSRGIDSIRSHMFDDSLSIETFGYVVDHAFKSQKLKVMICEDLRWQRCDIKSTSLLGNILSMNNARTNGCDEVIMQKNNILTEGGASNVFFANEDTVFTPALSNNILPGITRELLIDEIKQCGIKVEEGDYSVEDLKSAKSVWLTSSTKGLAQVTDIIDLDIKLNEENHLFQKCEEIFVEKFLSSC
jgi:D-alanine transaminase